MTKMTARAIQEVLVSERNCRTEKNTNPSVAIEKWEIRRCRLRSNIIAKADTTLVPAMFRREGAGSPPRKLRSRNQGLP